MTPDPRLDAAKAIPIMDVAARLDIMGDLRRAGRWWVGPCPRPGCGGDNRFSICPDKDSFHCRTCHGDGCGADGIGLVRMVRGLSFLDAVTWLVGAETVDPAEVARRRADNAKRQQERDAEAARHRQREIDRARAIWASGLPAGGTLVSDYLARRGMPPQICKAPPQSLRFHPDMPYFTDTGQGVKEVFRGPVMLAQCQAPTGQVTAVHITWIDPSRPKGKAVISGADGQPLRDAKGKPLPVKKIRGSKARAAIRLYSAPPHFSTLVMGEGIETTLTALAARNFTDAAYWAGIDLGHMAGRRVLRGEGMKYAGIPDLDDTTAFIPPPWIKRLVFIRDGDSDARLTRAKLESGLRRAGHFLPGLQMQIIDPGDGVDLNDVLMGEKT